MSGEASRTVAGGGNDGQQQQRVDAGLSTVKDGVPEVDASDVGHGTKLVTSTPTLYHGFRGVSKRDIPKFYGRGPQRVDEFLFHYEAFWELDPTFGPRFIERVKRGDYFEKEEDRQKEEYLIGALKMALHGSVCEDYRRFLETHPGVNYRQVRQWLSSQYDNALEKSAAAIEITHTRVRPGETLDSYTDRFSNLARQVGMQVHDENALPTSLYAMGLGVERLSTQVLQREPRTLHEAHRIARTVLATDRSIRDEFEALTGRPYDVGFASPYTSYQGPIITEVIDHDAPYIASNPLQLQIAMMQQQLQQLQMQQQGQAYSAQRPFAMYPQASYSETRYSNQTGGPSYPMSRNQSQGGGVNEQQGGYRRQGIRCNACGALGHYARECRLYDHRTDRRGTGNPNAGMRPQYSSGNDRQQQQQSSQPQNQSREDQSGKGQQA